MGRKIIRVQVRTPYEMGRVAFVLQKPVLRTVQVANGGYKVRLRIIDDGTVYEWEQFLRIVDEEKLREVVSRVIDAAVHQGYNTASSRVVTIVDGKIREVRR